MGDGDGVGGVLSVERERKREGGKERKREGGVYGQGRGLFKP